MVNDVSIRCNIQQYTEFRISCTKCGRDCGKSWKHIYIYIYIYIWLSIRKSLHLGFWHKRHIKVLILPKGGESNGPVLTDAALPPLERDVWLASASSLCLLSCLRSRKYANSPRHFRRYSAF